MIRTAVEETFTPDFVMHIPEGDMPLEKFIQYNIMLFAAFPDFTCTVEDQIAEGDKVVTRLTMRGTHQGPWRGIPATGKKIEISGAHVSRFAGGKIVEGWGYSDALGLM